MMLHHLAIGTVLRTLRHHKGPFSLLVLEVAFGFALLVHAIVGGVYYWRQARLPTGLDDDNLVFVERRFSAGPVALDEAERRLRGDALALTQVAGVMAVAAVNRLPFTDDYGFAMITEPDGPGARQPPFADPAGGECGAGTTWPVAASAGVARALGLPLLEGRDLVESDFEAGGGRPAAAVITARVRRDLFGDGPAVGRRLRGSAFGVAEVVGVAGDCRFRSPWIPDDRAVMFVGRLPVSEQRLAYVVRAVPGARPHVAAALGGGTVLPAVAGETLRASSFDRSRTRPAVISRGAVVILTWIAFLVLAVALAGSLALGWFSVAERTRQIGVRRALGATRGQIAHYFMVENAALTGVGLALGLVIAAAINVALRKLMPDLRLTPATIVVSMALFFAAGLLSAVVPALRAARIPPSAATRTV